jgi:hypothetical protein
MLLLAIIFSKKAGESLIRARKTGCFRIKVVQLPVVAYISLWFLS